MIDSVIAEWPTADYVKRKFRFYLAIWLGSGAVALIILPIAAILRRSGLPVHAPSALTSEHLQDTLSMALLAAGIAEILGVYAWHIPHYGIRMNVFRPRDRLVLGAAQGLGFLILAASVVVIGDYPWLKPYDSAALAAVATAFCVTYVRAIRHQHAFV